MKMIGIKKEGFLEWFYKQLERAWKECKKGDLVMIPKEVIEGIPPPFAEKLSKEQKKYDGAIRMNKLGRFSRKKFAFELGFMKGWALALNTDEGFKWTKINYEKRKENKELKEA